MTEIQLTIHFSTFFTQCLTKHTLFPHIFTLIRGTSSFWKFFNFIFIGHSVPSSSSIQLAWMMNLLGISIFFLQLINSDIFLCAFIFSREHLMAFANRSIICYLLYSTRTYRCTQRYLSYTGVSSSYLVSYTVRLKIAVTDRMNSEKIHPWVGDGEREQGIERERERMKSCGRSRVTRENLDRAVYGSSHGEARRGRELVLDLSCPLLNWLYLNFNASRIHLYVRVYVYVEIIYE